MIIVAATNRPDVLDPALMRPGRFDRQIVIDLPMIDGREQILKIHSKNIKLSDDVNLRRVARGTPGFSGAQLENLMNEAALLAGRASKERVEMTGPRRGPRQGDCGAASAVAAPSTTKRSA